MTEWIAILSIIYILPILISIEHVMMTPINVQEMFANLDGTIGTHLKSQRSALLMRQPSDYQRAFDFLVKSAVIGSFDIQIIKALAKRLKDMVKTEKDADGKPLKSLVAAEHFAESWRMFEEMTGAGSEGEAAGALSVSAAVEFIRKGAVSLCTHSDKSSELRQSHSASDSFLSGLNGALGVASVQKLADDASVLASSPFGQQLPLGVTMSADDQADLGIVCSSSRSVIAAVGNAAYSPYQQFFMMPLIEESGPATNLLEVMLTPRLDILGKLLGLTDSPTADSMAGWLQESSGERAFVATLFFALNHLAKGEYQEQVNAIERVVGPINLDPASYFNEPVGRGINHIQLPVAGGYVHATPLVNISLIRDINGLIFQSPEGEDQRLWRELFATIHIGGSKPQNAGSFWSSIKGDVNAFRSALKTQTGGFRLLKKNLREGKPVVYLRQDQAYAICPRQQAPDNPYWIHRKIFAGSKKALEKRTQVFVGEVVEYLTLVCNLIDTGAVSLTLLTMTAKGDALAERSILTGTATRADIARYASYLGRLIFNKTFMTKAEKRVVSDCLSRALPEALGKGV